MIYMALYGFLIGISEKKIQSRGGLANKTSMNHGFF